MALTNFKNNQKQDNGLDEEQKLMCSVYGCPKRWTVHLSGDKPKCSEHQWAKNPADYSLVLTPNVPFRDVDKVEKFLHWAMDMGADASWSCEEIPCRPEMIVFDHHYEELVEQAIPGDERSHQRRLVLTTHYAIVARTAYLIKHEKLRPPHTRLYQMPKGHVTWTINEVADLHWAERMLE